MRSALLLGHTGRKHTFSRFHDDGMWLLVGWSIGVEDTYVKVSLLKLSPICSYAETYTILLMIHQTGPHQQEAEGWAQLPCYGTPQSEEQLAVSHESHYDALTEIPLVDMTKNAERKHVTTAQAHDTGKLNEEVANHIEGQEHP